MARFEYSVLLLGIAAISFQLGTGFGTAPPPAPEVVPVADTTRLAALERRLDELASARPLAAPGTLTPVRREVVETGTPELADAVVALREAVAALGRGQPRSMPEHKPRFPNVAAVQSVLASTHQNGIVENSELLMLPLPQVLERLGRPTLVSFNADHITLQFVCGDSKLFVWVKDTLVVQVCMHHGSA